MAIYRVDLLTDDPVEARTHAEAELRLPLAQTTKALQLMTETPCAAGGAGGRCDAEGEGAVVLAVRLAIRYD